MQEMFMKWLKKIKNELNIPSSDLKSITKSLEQMKMPTPIELMTILTIPKPTDLILLFP